MIALKTALLLFLREPQGIVLVGRVRVSSTPGLGHYPITSTPGLGHYPITSTRTSYDDNGCQARQTLKRNII